jgi:glucosamine--fructose-6-phosphate aminotransferase (isomerizing)
MEVNVTRSISDYRLYEAIRRQPAELERLLTADEPIAAAARLLWEARRVFTVGIGTSSNAAAVAASMLGAAGLDARAWSSHDFVAYPPGLTADDAAIVFTHSGRKQFSRQALALLAERGAGVVIVTSTESALGEGDIPAGAVVLRTVARDPSSMFTVSHTAAMFVVARVADAIMHECLGHLDVVPGAVAAALAGEDEVAALARDWQGASAIVALGAGPHEPAAHEAHIKIAEAARRGVRSYAVEQFLHGPQVQVPSSEAFLVFAGEGPGLERTRQAVAFVQRLGCDVAWVSPVAAPEGAHWLRVPDVGEGLAPIVEVVPAQLLAGHLAALADVDGDSFRMDDPAFKAAREALDL